LPRLGRPEEVKLIRKRSGVGASLCAAPAPDVRVLIGPEGGFSFGEAALAREAGFRVVSLGPRLLKVPTAALAAITLIQYAWGDLA
jgi:16S rRNA (uracil1498-N3)-methyltransferase